MEPGPCSGVGGISEGPAAALLCEEGSVAGVHRALHPETKDLGYTAMTASLCGCQVILSPSLGLVFSRFSGQSLVFVHRGVVSFVV